MFREVIWSSMRCFFCALDTTFGLCLLYKIIKRFFAYTYVHRTVLSCALAEPRCLRWLSFVFQRLLWLSFYKCFFPLIAGHPRFSTWGPQWAPNDCSKSTALFLVNFLLYKSQSDKDVKRKISPARHLTKLLRGTRNFSLAYETKIPSYICRQICWDNYLNFPMSVSLLPLPASYQCCFWLFLLSEQFSIECWKTKTKVITTANQSKDKYHNEPMRTQSKYT